MSVFTLFCFRDEGNCIHNKIKKISIEQNY